MNSKGDVSQAGMLLIITVIISLFFLFFQTDLLARSGEKIQGTIALGCTKSLDGEGTWFMQKDFGNACPCDIDDKTHRNYVGKYYTVKQSLYLADNGKANTDGAAYKLFSGAYLKDFNIENPLRINEQDVLKIENYITQTNEGGTVDPIVFSYELNSASMGPQWKSGRPPLTIFCNGATSCSRQDFLVNWFEEGLGDNLKCKTPEAECFERYAVACDGE